MCGSRPSQERLELMLVRSGDLWHCTNPACLSELAIGTSRDTEVDRVYCVCGAVMKKHYHPPVFRYLDFLGEREQDALQGLAPDLVLETARKESRMPSDTTAAKYHSPSPMRARNALLGRAGLARTFGGLGSFLAVIFLGGGVYLLPESFTDPLQAQAVGLIAGGVIISL